MGEWRIKPGESDGRGVSHWHGGGRLNNVDDEIPVVVAQPGLGDVDGVLADLPELWMINYGDLADNEAMHEFGLRILVGTHIETGKSTVQYLIDGAPMNIDPLKVLGAVAWLYGQVNAAVIATQQAAA